MLLTIIFFHFSVIMQLFYNRNLGCQWRIFHSAYAGISLQTALLIMHGKNYVLHLIYCNIVMLSFILLRLRMRLSLFHMHEYMNKLNAFFFFCMIYGQNLMAELKKMFVWFTGLHFFLQLFLFLYFCHFCDYCFFPLLFTDMTFFWKAWDIWFFFLLNRKQQS